MNWLQKIAKVIETKHIPFQIYSALQHMTKQTWKMHKRNSYRDWSAQRNDAAIFYANYTTTVIYSDSEKAKLISGLIGKFHLILIFLIQQQV